MSLKDLLRSVGIGIAIALAVSGTVILMQVFFKGPISTMILNLLTTSIFLLCRIMIYVFIIGGVLMAVVVYWVGWDNLRFKLKRTQFRSAMIAKDYYKEYKRVRYDKFMGAMARFEQRVMDGEGPAAGDTMGEGPADPRAHPDSDVTYKDGKIWGVVRTYYDDGTLESEISYQDGRYHGIYRTYYPDGRLHNEKVYYNGRMNGVFKAWDQDGSPFFEIMYKDNKQHGPDKIYYRNGAVQYEDMYVDGRRMVRKTFDEGGRLKFVQNFHPDPPRKSARRRRHP